MSIDFLMPYAGGLVFVEVILMNPVIGHDPGFLVSIENQSQRPSWEEIERHMIKNDIFAKLPPEAKTNVHTDTFTSSKSIAYAIHYGAPHEPQLS